MLLTLPRTPTWQEPTVPPKLPPHVVCVRNKVGRPYYYLHRYRGTARAQKRIPLPDPHAEPDAFWTAYAEAMRLPPPVVKTDTVGKLLEAWQASPEWGQLKPSTKREWGRLCRVIATAWGELEVRGVEPKHVLRLRDGLAQTPATANNVLRVLQTVFGWSVPRGWRDDNPVREIKHLKAGDGYEPWPWDVIETARAELRPDLWWAVALALYTGQRLSDVLAMRWSAINAGGLLAVKQGKTGKHLMVPLHRDLRAVLETVPRKAVTILTSAEGVPWRGGFQTAWRKHRPAIVVERGLVFHGLRKSAVVTLLEAGCTDAEVAAITGQSRAMVEHYGRLVNQEKLARSAILRWEQSRQ